MEHRRTGHEGYLLRDTKSSGGGAGFKPLVDVVLVVGAKNSSNSNRLREIAARAGVPSYLIADRAELDLGLVREANTIGLTAGASAPEVLVEGVIEALRGLGPLDVALLPGVQENVEFRLPFEFLATSA